MSPYNIDIWRYSKLKKLWQWILFEFAAFNVYVAGFCGCAAGCYELFKNISVENPIWFLLKGTLGVLVGLLGIGFLLGIGAIVILGGLLNIETICEKNEFLYRN